MSRRPRGRVAVLEQLEPPKILLTQGQVALRLRVGAPAVRRLAQHNDLPGRIVAGQWRCSASELERWCAQHSWDRPKPAIRARDLIHPKTRQGTH